MPRRRPRFSDLEKLFRDSGGTAAPGSRLAGYIAFKKGENRIKIVNKPSAADKKRYGFAVLPFNVSPGDGADSQRYAAPITNMSNVARTALGLSDARVGYEAIEAATEQSSSYYPALLRCFVATAQAASEVTSAVTQKKYNRLMGRSYSIPFGRTLTSVVNDDTGAAETSLANVDEEEVRRSITAIAKSSSQGTLTAKGVSYDPEVFRGGRAALASPPAQ